MARKRLTTIIYADNNRVRFDYEILDKFEAGIKLLGFEVKSVKSGKANLTGSHCAFHKNELYLLNAKIPPFQKKNIFSDYNEERSRKLLLKKRELEEIFKKTKANKLTIVPLKLYNKDGLIKAEIALARGLKKYQKKEKIKEREVKRTLSQVLKESRANF